MENTPENNENPLFWPKQRDFVAVSRGFRAVRGFAGGVRAVFERDIPFFAQIFRERFHNSGMYTHGKDRGKRVYTFEACPPIHGVACYYVFKAFFDIVNLSPRRSPRAFFFRACGPRYLRLSRNPTEYPQVSLSVRSLFNRVKIPVRASRATTPERE